MTTVTVIHFVCKVDLYIPTPAVNRSLVTWYNKQKMTRRKLMCVWNLVL